MICISDTRACESHKQPCDTKQRVDGAPDVVSPSNDGDGEGEFDVKD